jgi:hypothetical protein
VSWKRRFADPIVLPDGRRLVTLKDTGDYITKLPKAEHSAREWQTAIEMLLKAAERSEGWLWFARIAVMQALNRREQRVFNPDRKDHHWGKRKLKRDRYQSQPPIDLDQAVVSPVAILYLLYLLGQ